MTRLSKITAALTAAMVLLLSFSASAAVVEPVDGQILLNQDFAGLSALPDDWTVKKAGQSGGTAIEPAFNTLGLSTNLKGNLWVGCDTAFDAEGSGYTASFSFAKMASGAMVMVVGGGEDWYASMSGHAVQSQSSGRLTASPVGYTIQLQHVAADDSLTLYKNGTPIIQKSIAADLKNATGQAPGSVGGLRSYDVSLNVTGAKVVLTVTGHATYDYEGVFEYDDPAPIYSGYAGIYFASTTNATDGSTGTVYSASITGDASTKSTDEYYLYKQFGASDTAATITELGFVQNGAYDIAPTADGLQLCAAGSGGSAAILDQYVFDGTYNLRASVYVSYNSAAIYLNYQDENNYYRLDYGRAATAADDSLIPGYILKKCVDGVLTDLAAYDLSADDEYIFLRDTTPVEITVTNASGQTTIAVTAYNDGQAYPWTYSDTDSPISSGKIGFKSNASGDTYLKSLRIYSAEPAYTSGSKKGEAVVLSIPYMPWASASSRVITAVYSTEATKDFITAGMKSLSDFENGAVTVIPAQENQGDIAIRTFLWENLDTMKPIMHSIDVIPAE